MTKPVCLILGAGAGIGGHVAKRFAREGYHACLARRSDKAGLDKLVAEIEADGGSAAGFIINAVEDGSIEQLVTQIEADIGAIEVAVFNLGAQIGDRALASTTLKAFEMGWRLATFGLFRLASIVQGIKKRVLTGTASSAHATEMAGRVPHLAAAAWGFAKESGA